MSAHLLDAVTASQTLEVAARTRAAYIIQLSEVLISSRYFVSSRLIFSTIKDTKFHEGRIKSVYEDTACPSELHFTIELFLSAKA